MSDQRKLSHREHISAPWFRMWRSRDGLTSEQRRAVLDAVALRPTHGSTVRFAILQALSVVIAVMGLTINSAAVVIGAMLIAPLMSPIMGVSASLAMGWGNRAVRMMTRVALAAFGSVALAYALAPIGPGNGLTDEVLARTAPGTADLLIALAAGLAGAYATVRPDISASLSGVAVAVALVPPLATVGITCRAGEGDLAAGAALLFTTNLAAIVLAGLVVFPLTGFVPSRRLSHVKVRVLLHSAAVASIVLLLGALLINRSIAAADQADEFARTRHLVNSWLTGTGLELDHVSVKGNNVVVSVAGPQAPPEPSGLARRLSDELGPGTNLEIRWSQRSSVATNGNGLSDIDPAIIDEEARLWLGATGQNASNFTLDIEVDAKSVMINVNGPVAPPDHLSLERRLANRLGFTIPVTVNASVTVPGAQTQKDLQVITDRAGAWAADRNLVVASVSFEDNAPVVVVEGPEPPRESASLQSQLEADLLRPVALTLRYRSATVVPTNPKPAFRWPADCTSVPLAGTTEVRTGFTASELGRWLERLVSQGAIGLNADGSTFAHDYADGALHVWAAPALPNPKPSRQIAGIGDASGPRPGELWSATSGNVTIFALVQPHDLHDPTTTACLPSTTQLDAWFAALSTGATSDPFIGALDGYDIALPRTESPMQHVLAVAAAAVLPVNATEGGAVALRTDDGDLGVHITTRILAPTTGVTRRRAGGLTIETTGSSSAASALLDRLAAALRTTPYVGQRAPTEP